MKLTSKDSKESKNTKSEYCTEKVSISNLFNSIDSSLDIICLIESTYGTGDAMIKNRK